jgi:hypothetical protein
MLATAIRDRFADEEQFRRGFHAVLSLHRPLVLGQRAARGRSFHARLKAFVHDRADNAFDALGPDDDERPAQITTAKSFETTQIRKAVTLVRLGHLSKAASALRRAPPPVDSGPVSGNDLPALEAKFPAAAPPEDLPMIPDAPVTPWAMADMAEFTAFLRKTANGSSGGMTGITGDHLAPAFDEPAIVNDIYTVIEALANVQFPDWTWPYLNPTRLLGIAEGPKVRPLGIGDYLLRTASTARVRTLTHADYAKVFLRPDLRVFQLGSGVKAGVEAAFHLVRLLLDANPDWICIKGDCSNGYNSPDATCMLAAVARLFPSQSLLAERRKCSPETGSSPVNAAQSKATLMVVFALMQSSKVSSSVRLRQVLTPRASSAPHLRILRTPRPPYTLWLSTMTLGSVAPLLRRSRP